MQDIIIAGAGGFAREVIQLLEDINESSPTYNILGYIDENRDNHGKILNNYIVLGDINILSDYPNVNIVIAVGNPKTKKMFVEKMKKYNVKFPNIIHHSAVVGKHNDIGKGIIITANNVITTNIKIDDFVTINLSCTIGHDSIIGKYSTILPGVNVSGNVKIKELVDIGTGSRIIPSVTVGENTIIGAGAVVTKDLPSNCTAVGIPAKPIKFHEASFIS